MVTQHAADIPAFGVADGSSAEGDGAGAPLAAQEARHEQGAP